MERVAVIGGWRQRFLDRPRADPAEQVEVGPRLVVGSRPARTSEWLLSDHSAGRLVIDVEVPRCMLQGPHGVIDGVALASEDRTGQGVFTGGIHRLQNAVEIVGGVDIQGHDGAEDFLFHRFEVGVFGEDHSRFHEVTHTVITPTSAEDVGVLAVFRVLDVSLDFVE